MWQQSLKITIYQKPNWIMLIDKSTNQTYSTRNAAIRDLGKIEFKKRIKDNKIEYQL